MIEWTNLPKPECYWQDPSQVYVIPCDGGSEIWLSGKKCFVENASVYDIVYKLQELDAISVENVQGGIEFIIKQFQKENENDY
jgi:hypothetical protein